MAYAFIIQAFALLIRAFGEKKDSAGEFVDCDQTQTDPWERLRDIHPGNVDANPAFANSYGRFSRGENKSNWLGASDRVPRSSATAWAPRVEALSPRSTNRKTRRCGKPGDFKTNEGHRGSVCYRGLWWFSGRTLGVRELLLRLKSPLGSSAIIAGVDPMTASSEEVAEGRMDRDKASCMSSRFEAAHPASLSAGWLMRNFRPAIRTLVPAVLLSVGQDLLTCHAIAAQFNGDTHLWRIAQAP